MHPLTRPVMASEIATMLSLSLVGVDRRLTHIASLSEMQPGALGFATEGAYHSSEGGTLIAVSAEGDDGNTFLFSTNPRLDFIRALRGLKREGLLLDITPPGTIDESAKIHPTANVEAGADIGAGVTVGEYAVIKSCVSIGPGSNVGAYTILGSSGFGFERDERGVPLRLPHLGRVVIGEEVDLGSHCCVDRGALGDTVVGRFVKCDHHTYIAHGVNVGPLTLIMSGATLNGSSKVEECCWIGTSALIKEGLRVGANSTVGMGAVVISDVPKNTTVVGVPATPIR